MTTNQAYTLHYARGPFAGSVDPWAEDDFYFNQLHSGIIAKILGQIWEPLFNLGYVVSKEASLQIAEIHKPDIAVRQLDVQPDVEYPRPLDYSSAAAAILAEPGVAIDSMEAEFQAIFIRALEDHRLVTVIEIISPSNKDTSAIVMRYRERRQDSLLSQGVNVVEVDLTRSVKRLLEHPLTAQHPYHIAIFIPDDRPRVVTVDLGEPVKRVAIPLRADVVGVDLQDAYGQAYIEAMIAMQIDSKGGYIPKHLPFPSLLTGEQRDQLLKQVKVWKSELDRLKPSS